MKKIFSILLLGMMILTGMHLSFATHICGGEVAGVKWSFSEEKASCGMEMSEDSTPEPLGIASACCHDRISNFTVDNNYKTSSVQLSEPVKQLISVFLVPESLGFNTLNTALNINTNVRPPGNYPVSAVNLSDICVFRI